MNSCTGLEPLLQSLENCVIKELELSYWSKQKSEVLNRFIKAQERNLKKLTGWNCDYNLLLDLKGLRLDYLNFNYYQLQSVSLEFLRHQTDLKSLRLDIMEYSNENFDVICGLTNLETLELDGWPSGTIGLRNIHRLKNLKRLQVSEGVIENIFDCLQFGILKNLQELAASFEGASLDFVKEMKRITPNLKKIEISCASSDTINALLENLENLESVKMRQCDTWELSGKVHPKIKHLDCQSRFKFDVEQLTKQFPNLEFLNLSHCCLN
jgi:hypothetical protein